MNADVLEKLKILAESAKYDVSCSSSGTVRKGRAGEVGNTVGGVGICHSFAEDGRCISLLKVMLTNFCIYDCAYCINRRSNDIKRTTLSVTPKSNKKSSPTPRGKRRFYLMRSLNYFTVTSAAPMVKLK